MTGMLRMTAAEFKARALKKECRIKNVRRKVVNGIEFDSTREARRHQDLMLMQQAGQITGLRRQVPFAIEINGVHVCVWIADFVYWQQDKSGRNVKRVEDCKGWKTDVYKLKKKMVEAYYGFRIIET